MRADYPIRGREGEEERVVNRASGWVGVDLYA